MYRLLGSGEQIAWLYDQIAPIHFVVIARVVGEFNIDQLEQALAWVQQRHPLLRVCIVPDGSGKPWFKTDSASIPLQIVQRSGEQHWLTEVERQLCQPFEWTKAPLIRVVLLYGANISELVVTCHHAIGDGLSTIYLLRDILQAVGEPDCERRLLPERPAFEDLMAEVTGTPQKSTVCQDVSGFRETTFEQHAVTQEQDNNELQLTIKSTVNHPQSLETRYYNRRPHLLSWSLSLEETTSLIYRCRQEQTTVHAAIGAAFLLAISEERDTNSQQSSLEQPFSFKCLSAINLRLYPSPPIKEDFGCYTRLEATTHTLTPDLTFWDLARSLKSQLDDKVSPDKIFKSISEIQAFMSTNPSPNQIKKMLTEANSYDVMVSNLGRLNISQQFGQIQLQAIYGPVVMTHIKNYHMVGVATLGDRMFFTFVYFEPEMVSAEAVRLQQAAMRKLNLEYAAYC